MKNGKRIHEITIIHYPDTDADVSYLEQEGFEDRLRQYKDGQFSFIGIRAKAVYSVGGTPAVLQKITSGGLWGIESDSSDSYLTEVENEELLNLRSHLAEIGFSKRAISAAFQNVERKEI